MTDVMQDLLIDFDEMGFAPTTACPNPDKYACEWKGKLIAEINCLQEQLEAAANGQETLQKALAEKDKEVERLNNNISAMAVTMHNCAKATRAEAIRTFAEMLKQRCSANSDINYYILKKLVDNLVKEMVGDAE